MICVFCPGPCVGDCPDIKQLLEVMRIKNVDITTRWRDLGLELVDSNKILKVIEVNHRNDVDTCCRVMFETWLDMRPSANWNQLITALSNIGMNTAADVIRKQLQSGKYKYCRSMGGTRFLFLVSYLRKCKRPTCNFIVFAWADQRDQLFYKYHIV